MSRSPALHGVTVYTILDESGKVSVKVHVPEGHFTTHQLGVLINKLTMVKEQADKLKRAQARDKKKGGKK